MSAPMASRFGLAKGNEAEKMNVNEFSDNFPISVMNEEGSGP